MGIPRKKKELPELGRLLMFWLEDPGKCQPKGGHRFESHLRAPDPHFSHRPPPWVEVALRILRPANEQLLPPEENLPFLVATRRCIKVTTSCQEDETNQANKVGNYPICCLPFFNPSKKTGAPDMFCCSCFDNHANKAGFPKSVSSVPF